MSDSYAAAGLSIASSEEVGFAIEAPRPVPPVFELIARLGRVGEAEMWEVFNMGCGFVAVVPDAQAALEASSAGGNSCARSAGSG